MTYLDVLLCLAVAFLELVLVDVSVLQCEAAAEQVVRRVGVYARGTFLATLTWHLRPNLITLQL